MEIETNFYSFGLGSVRDYLISALVRVDIYKQQNKFHYQVSEDLPVNTRKVFMKRDAIGQWVCGNVRQQCVNAPLSVDRSQFNVHTDERTQLCGARSFLARYPSKYKPRSTLLNFKFNDRTSELTLVATAIVHGPHTVCG
jgi:hypothetical protein